MNSMNSMNSHEVCDARELGQQLGSEDVREDIGELLLSSLLQDLEDLQDPAFLASVLLRDILIVTGPGLWKAEESRAGVLTVWIPRNRFLVSLSLILLGSCLLASPMPLDRFPWLSLDPPCPLLSRQRSEDTPFLLDLNEDGSGDRDSVHALPHVGSDGLRALLEVWRSLEVAASPNKLQSVKGKHHTQWL